MSDPGATRAPVGLVLAGGEGRRMGGAKHARRLGGRSLLQRAVDRLAAQVDIVLLSCNDPLPEPCGGIAAQLPDPLPGRQGPLAGVLAGLEYLAAHPGLGSQLLSVAVDTPWFPDDLAARLRQAQADAGAAIAIAASPQGDHPVFALWPAGMAAELRAWLVGQPDRSVRRFQARYPTVTVAWQDAGAFHNLNTPEQLAAAEQGLSARHPRG